jgi:hypothetical protein
MRIGTTPTHTFTLPEEIAAVTAKARVIYAQCNNVVLTKEVTALTGNDVVVKLTQEETLTFHNRRPVDIQLRVLTTGGDALTSDIISRDCCDCLENEVIT